MKKKRIEFENDELVFLLNILEELNKKGKI